MSSPPPESPFGERPLAIVTGGAVRVGRAICLELAAAGCDVLLTYRGSAAEAEETVRLVTQLGVRAAAEKFDLNDLSKVERWGKQASSIHPRIDILVHNASIYGPTKLGEITPEELMRFQRINAAAPLILSQSLSAKLAQSPLPGGAAIIAMADMHAMGRPRRDFAPYSMSKAALIEMVRTLAVALAPKIRVNALAPGVVAFPASGYESDEAMQAAYLARVPLQRSGTPQDAAKAVRWLAMEATYVTGEVIRLDGGRWLA